MPRILHILSQRPGRTGSGVTLEAMLACAARAGYEQQAIIGVPADDPQPTLAALPPDAVRPLVFGRPPLPFALPGMSDVMPYPSSVFASLTPAQIEVYRSTWKAHVARAVEDFAPDLIHVHHIWLLASLIKDVAPHIPVVDHCHATGLRQMRLCPQLAADVRAGCARNDRFCVLHAGHAAALAATLEVPRARIAVVGAGFREELFHPRGAPEERGQILLYAGKYSHAKGLPWLLDAVAALGAELPGLRLRIAGSGAGAEAEELRARMEAMPRVELLGQLSQEALAEHMRQAAVFVLPSFYEGLPLVLIEALACGARPVCTALPGVAEELAPRLGDALRLVPLPRLRGVDTPEPEDLPRFVDDLRDALRAALEEPPPDDPTESVRDFTWAACFARIDRVWRDLLGG